MTVQKPADRIQSLARSAGKLSAVNRADQAILGHFLGALHGLRRAEALHVRDRSGDALPPTYSDELRRVARAIGRGGVPRDLEWLGDFYLNSALYRLASVAERSAKRAGQDRRLVKDVSEEVNRMKHGVEGVLAGRSVGFDRAVSAAEKVYKILESVLGRVR